MAKSKTKKQNIEGKVEAHFEAVKNFYKKTTKDVHLPRKIRKEIARKKTLENKESNE